MRSTTTAFSILFSFFSLFAAAQSPVTIQIVDWAEGFFNPTDLANAGDDRLFVAQQTGVIAIVPDSGTVLPTPFLDISSKVIFTAEQGLLGLAFDPAYTSNGFFYVHYVADDGLGHRSVVARYSVSTDPDVADPLSEVVLFTWPQTSVEHKGGDLAFAPDSTLFISFGDGSSGGDPQNSAQDLSDPLGSILRIRPEPGGTYSIPSDNPFANAGGDTLPEIWAYGVRNPFRITVDAPSGALWFGDVGQSSWEEVDRWPVDDNSGPDFGWRCHEGFVDYDFSLCDINTPFVDPLAVEANALNGGSWCAVAGGRVYRGAAHPRLQGRYLFADYCSGQVRSLRPDGIGGWTEEVLLQNGPVGMVAIDQDASGELFAVNNFQHKLVHIVDPCPPLPNIGVASDSLHAPPGVGYAWYADGVLLPMETGAVIAPMASGNYHVLVDLGNGCVLSSDTVQFVISTLAGALGAPTLRVRPNPAHDEVLI
ncbi:MAG: PQQ-dependent sugar dehydrogenase, partial [Flavobacteriales bacterium]